MGSISKTLILLKYDLICFIKKRIILTQTDHNQVKIRKQYIKLNFLLLQSISVTSNEMPQTNESPIQNKTY